MPDKHHILARHVVATLPDSVEKRRQLLEATLALLPPKHPDRGPVYSMSTLLARHITLQEEFAFSPGEERK